MKKMHMLLALALVVVGVTFMGCKPAETPKAPEPTKEEVTTPATKATPAAAVKTTTATAPVKTTAPAPKAGNAATTK